jgi:positive regulator of sigma E activity
MQNGKIFPTKTRKALAILGMFLVTLLLVSSFLNIINHIFSVLGMVVIVFTFLMIARYMRRYDERNKLAQIELANHKGLRE